MSIVSHLLIRFSQLESSLQISTFKSFHPLNIQERLFCEVNRNKFHFGIELKKKSYFYTNSCDHFFKNEYLTDLPIPIHGEDRIIQLGTLIIVL